MVLRERMRKWRELELGVLEKVFLKVSDGKTFESLVSHATKLISMTLFHENSYTESFFDEEQATESSDPAVRSDSDMLSILDKMIPDV